MGKPSLLKKRSLTVLIAEDNSDLRETLHAEFILEGLTVLTVQNGTEAVDATRRLQPDLVLMDILMPLMQGIEATRILKDDQKTRHIPIIILTAADRKEDIVKGLEAGAIDCIAKPLFIPELKARVKAILQHKVMYDELRRIQNTLARKGRVQTVKELTKAVQGSVSGPLTVILGKVDILRKTGEKPSEDDLKTLENSAIRIRDIVKHLGIVECLCPEPYLGGAEFLDLAFLN